MKERIEKLHRLIDSLFKRVEILEKEVVRKGKKKVFLEKRCTLKHIYYSSRKDFVGRKGLVVGESKDKREWQIVWEGLSKSTKYNYPKSDIKILRKS